MSSRIGWVAAIVAALGSTPSTSPVRAQTTINFESLPNHETVDTQFESLGVSMFSSLKGFFGNLEQPGPRIEAPGMPLAFLTSNALAPGIDPDNDAKAGVVQLFTAPVTVEFSAPVCEVSVVGIRVNREGLVLDAYDSLGNLVDTDVYDPCGGLEPCNSDQPDKTLSVSGGDIVLIETHLLRDIPLVSTGYLLDDLMFVTDVVPVAIDIKPGDDENTFKNDGHGVIPVAILGSADFDATLVDETTVALEGMGVKMAGKSGNLLAHVEDVNGDGFEDLVVLIEDDDGVFEPGDDMATLTGVLFDGTRIEGTDSIFILP